VLPHRGGGAETYIDLLEAIEGYDHGRLALAGGRTPAAAAASLGGRYARIARRARHVDLVHLHGDVAAALALPLLRRRPAVWTTHGLHLARRASGLPLHALRAALRRVIGACACTICTSEAERGELRALAGAHAGRLAVVRNGIELPAPVAARARAQARAALDLADGQLAVLFLGELEARKRPLDAIAAAERARDAGAPVVLLVAGDGPLGAEVGARSGAAVRPLGFRRDRERLLAAADVLVMPSEREGLSFAILEAMGAGVAPVVSDGPGNPEAVGGAGIVVPVGDVGALARTLARLAAQPHEVRALGAAARERVATTLTADALRAGVGAAYRRALAGAAGSA
jgi:glycosyltransferase involved in cell wall biosynthesis